MDQQQPEVSRRVPISRIGAGFEQTIEATAEECRGLARRLGVPAVVSLRCRFCLDAHGEGRIDAAGDLRCELTRICVVSLEPFETTVSDRFVLRFVPEDAIAGGETLEIDPDAADEVGYAGGLLDLGEAACEQLALVLDPYPRMPQLGLSGVAAPEDGPEDPRGGFAQLKNWHVKNGRGTGSGEA
ncbi:YceD family protein [Lichenicoccus sp.]|uniref:YceD family protein n=1 Tax=Lichenicoccus sp. TaxID=2781899 RepID=UPI003D145648